MFGQMGVKKQVSLAKIFTLDPLGTGWSQNNLENSDAENLHTNHALFLNASEIVIYDP